MNNLDKSKDPIVTSVRRIEDSKFWMTTAPSDLTESRDANDGTTVDRIH
jgi:hypothetical protein